MFVLQGLEIIDPEANFCTPGFGMGVVITLSSVIFIGVIVIIS
jgi:hypothetical protein